ncbi:hypothetical protein PoB_004628200 [Plakobranchus ocellatus]|uniref:Uncharacterized protein n=1 Tax=Plakobranchus ocellatus TaxID=259542 RepID=A0AAV4BKD7_9GAST|nr:hypothetical protein PoB_004628200 [Plakobranchus ocellatus]
MVRRRDSRCKTASVIISPLLLSHRISLKDMRSTGHIPTVGNNVRIPSSCSPYRWHTLQIDHASKSQKEVDYFGKIPRRQKTMPVPKSGSEAEEDREHVTRQLLCFS